MALGWAVVDGGRINVRTVSDTRRAAIVNWLVAARGILVTMGMADDEIEQLWHNHAGRAECATVEVRVAGRS